MTQRQNTYFNKRSEKGEKYMNSVYAIFLLTNIHIDSNYKPKCGYTKGMTTFRFSYLFSKPYVWPSVIGQCSTR